MAYDKRLPLPVCVYLLSPDADVREPEWFGGHHNVEELTGIPEFLHSASELEAFLRRRGMDVVFLLETRSLREAFGEDEGAKAEKLFVYVGETAKARQPVQA